MEARLSRNLPTTEPGPDVSPIHDRQMVVLDRADWLAWLDLTRPEPELAAARATVRFAGRGTSPASSAPVRLTAGRSGEAWVMGGPR